MSDNKITTPVFRVSFPAVFQAKAGMDGGPGKFGVTMLFDMKDPATAKGLETMKVAVKAAVVEKWGADQTKWPKPLRLPFRKGEEKDYEGYGPGVIFASATSKMKPGLVDGNLQAIIEPSEFYAGCYARATINAYAYDRNGNRGVAFGLRNIQKVKDGDSFSGASKPEMDFQPIEGAASSGAAKADEDGTSDPLGL